MNKLVLTIAIMGGCFVLCMHYHKVIDDLSSQRDIYKHNTELLLNRIRNIYDEKDILEQKNALLENDAVKDKAFFDWNTDISHTLVIKRLRRH